MNTQPDELADELAEALRLYGFMGTHPALDLFPLPERLIAMLADSAKGQGWAVPVDVTPDGILLDGRARLIASVRIGLDVPIFRVQTDDPTAWVASRNLYRKHHTPAEIAAAEEKAQTLSFIAKLKRTGMGRVR